MTAHLQNVQEKYNAIVKIIDDEDIYFTDVDKIQTIREIINK